MKSENGEEPMLCLVFGEIQFRDRDRCGMGRG